jgi:hypothetical protein
MEKPCKCGQTPKCGFTSTCCFCADSRKPRDVKTYVDQYGFLGIEYIPQDIHYCSSCKTTTKSLVEIVEELKKIIPASEYVAFRNKISKEVVQVPRAKLERDWHQQERAERLEREKLEEKSRSKYFIPTDGLSVHERKRGPKTVRKLKVDHRLYVS